MSTDSSSREEAFPYFITEASDLLQSIEQDLLSLREDRSSARVHSLMRSAHTLKGASATVGLETVQHVAHVLEDVFRALYNPDIEIDDEVEALLFEGYDCLRMPLMAEINGSGGNIDESNILNRAAAIISRLQDKLGELFDRETPIPTAEELGFDIVKSMFEAGVDQRLNELEHLLETGAIAEQVAQLRSTCEVFVGLAESLQLPGFGQIAQLTLEGLAAQPNNGQLVAQAYVDLRAGQQQVLNGDRTQGGTPSAALLAAIAQPKLTSAAEFPSQTEAAAAVSSEAMGQALPAMPPLEGWEDSLEGLFGELTLASGVMPLPDLAAILPPNPLLEAPEVEVPHSEESTGTTSPELASLESALPPAIASLDDLFGSIPVAAGAQVQDSQAQDSQAQDSEDASATIPEAPEDEAEATAVPPTAGAVAAQPPSPQIQEAVAQAVAQASQPVAPSARLARNTPKSSTWTSSAMATSTQRGRESRVNVRVGLDQVLRLDHIVGELLTNQTQSTEQDEQLRQGILELLAQLRSHRRTLSDLQNTAQQIGLDEWQASHVVGSPQAAPALQAPATSGDEHPLSNAGKGKAMLPLSLGDAFDALEMDRYSDLHIFTQKALNEAVQLEIVIEAVAQQTKQTRQTGEARQRLFHQLRDDLAAVRLKPVGELLNRFPRVLQQLSTTYGKPVELTLVGGHVLIDKVTLDSLYDSLLHLVRNAFDHGIETAEERQAVGKSPTGRIEISAYQKSNRTVIEIRDDGRGINLERIAEKAIAQGLISGTEAQPIAEGELLEFLFHPGFSTADSVSELSGRGVGLDVVRSQIESLDGLLSIQSEPGKGTCFILQFPLAVTITKQLICRCGGTTYAIAADGIEQVILPRPGQLRSLGDGRQVLNLPSGDRELWVPVQPLAQLMNYAHPPLEVESGEALMFQPILLVACREGLRGLQVDQVMGEQELSIRTLDGAVSPPAYIQGCTILGDAHLALAIEPSLLLDSGCDSREAIAPGAPSQHSAPTSSAPAASHPRQRAPRILVIDDSLTQRRTLERTLKTRGYEVSQAEDGLDALVNLKQQADVDLIICDLEMPRMNGFEFLSQTRSLAAVREIPVVILTSRSGGKYRQLALELGAAEFLSKPYADYELLNTAARLLETTLAATV